jgi:hypothetical protein
MQSKAINDHISLSKISQGGTPKKERLGGGNNGGNNKWD